MKFRRINFLALFFIPAVLFCQDLRQSLLVCHADQAQGSQIVFKQKIYAYHFVNGTYTGREELLAFDGKKNGHDFIRTDRGKNLLYKNRYVLTGIGNILDLKEKKILFDGKANLVTIRNDSAIYYTNDAFRGKFYSVYNFKTNQYGEVTNLLFKAKAGKDIEFDKTEKPFKINYYPQGKPKVELLSDAGYGQQLIKGTKYIPDPPVYWLNDTVFIYAHFNQNGTEISLQKINIETGQKAILGSAVIASGNAEARFEKVENKLILFCAGSELHYDLKKNLLTAPSQCDQKFKFAYDIKCDNKGRTIHFNGKEIGRFNFDTEMFSPSENTLATVKLLTVADESYQQGLNIWNQSSNTWRTIEGEEVTALLGWINE